ncbi:MAG TPA: hypothetical protein VF212_07715 [Longimicrobiales bacterium]
MPSELDSLDGYSEPRGEHRTATLDPPGEERVHTPFPFARVREIHSTGGCRCPRCGAGEIQRWGQFKGRRRYRCRACDRTFSDLTGTPLAYLKRLDGWAPFCACLLLGLSVRRTAAWIGLHKDTAFRWRHRLLASLLATENAWLRGTVTTEQTWFTHSLKGSRSLGRAPRRRAVRGLAFRQPALAWVLLAVDPHGAAAGAAVGPSRPGKADVARMLEGRLAADAVLTTRADPRTAVASFAREHGLRWRRRTARDRVTLPAPGRATRADDGPGPEHGRGPGPGATTWDPGMLYVRRLKRTLGRFRGVATRYLAHYLVWFRLIDAPRDPRRACDVVTAGVFP